MWLALVILGGLPDRQRDDGGQVGWAGFAAGRQRCGRAEAGEVDGDDVEPFREVWHRDDAARTLSGFVTSRLGDPFVSLVGRRESVFGGTWA